MQLRQTPGGTWCGTEKDYKQAMKAEGIDLKTFTGRTFVDVPVDKKGLMEFLTFHNVNCVAPMPPGFHVVAAMADNGPTLVASQIEGAPLPPPTPTPVSYADASVDLDRAFLAAPLGQQLTLAALACEAAYTQVK